MKSLLIITQKVDENDQLLGFFIEWLRLFSYKFKKVTVLCLEKGSFSLPENVRVVSLGKDRGVGKFKQLITFYQLLITLRNDYHSVLVHMNPIWVNLGGPIWRMIRKKIFLWYTHKAVTPKLRLAEKIADVIFTASRESFRLSSEKVVVTGHGIDTELFRPNSSKKDLSSKLKILSVGRIAPVKNYEVLIETAKILKSRNIDFSVTMIGEAPLEKDKEYEKNIRKMIAEYNLDSNFIFEGKIINKDLPLYYQSHDLFIHLSNTGSLDKVILEAMACGIRVLSSNDSSRAFLSESLIFKGNDPVELAEKIDRISDKDAPSLREYVVNNHNLTVLIDKVSALINE